MADAVKVGEVAVVCRTKNAGPALLTIDVAFDDEELYERAKASLDADVVAGLYDVDGGSVTRVCWDAMKTIKLSFPRVLTAGAPGDRDVYGCQQHAPILALEL